MSATLSGRLMKLMPKNWSQSITWAARKMGAMTRQRWKAKVATVMAGLFFQPRALKGMSQLKMERSEKPRSIKAMDEASFAFAS